MADENRKVLKVDVTRLSPGELEVRGEGALRLNERISDKDLEPMLKALVAQQMSRGDNPASLSVNLKATRDQLIAQANFQVEINKYGEPSLSGDPNGRFVSDKDYAFSGIARLEEGNNGISIKPSVPLDKLHNFDAPLPSKLSIPRKSNDHSQLAVDVENASVISKLTEMKETMGISGTGLFELTNSRSKINSLSPKGANTVAPNTAFDDMRLVPLGDLKIAVQRLADAMMKAGIPESLTPKADMQDFELEKWKPFIESNSFMPISVIDASALSDNYLAGVSLNTRKKMVDALSNDLAGPSGPQASLREALWRSDEDATALVIEAAAVSMGAEYGPELTKQAKEWAMELGKNQELRPDLFEKINQYVIENAPKPEVELAQKMRVGR